MGEGKAASFPGGPEHWYYNAVYRVWKHFCECFSRDAVHLLTDTQQIQRNMSQRCPRNASENEARVWLRKESVIGINGLFAWVYNS